MPTDKAAAVEIPVNILKNSETSLFELPNWINEVFEKNKFPDCLKLCDIISVYEKLDPGGKANYRPMSDLPLLSKVFEKVGYVQLYFLCELVCGFRKAHSTQCAVVRLL